MTQIKTSETKIKDTCDQLIAWGFCCNAPAKFLVIRLGSTEYAIMCEQHRRSFEREYPHEFVEYHGYSAELVRRLADEADIRNGNFAAVLDESYGEHNIYR